MQYYFRAPIRGEIQTYALISEYSAPHAELLESSSGAVAASKYEGQNGLKVIEAKSIVSAVAMVPYPHEGLGAGKWHFLVEKMGLEMFGFRGDEETDEDEVNRDSNNAQ